MRMGALIEIVTRAFAAPRDTTTLHDNRRVEDANMQEENARTEYRRATDAVSQTAERAVQKVTHPDTFARMVREMRRQ